MARPLGRHRPHCQRHSPPRLRRTHYPARILWLGLLNLFCLLLGLLWAIIVAVVASLGGIVVEPYHFSLLTFLICSGTGLTLLLMSDLIPIPPEVPRSPDVGPSENPRVNVVRCPIHGIAYDEERETCPECARG